MPAGDAGQKKRVTRLVKKTIINIFAAWPDMNLLGWIDVVDQKTSIPIPGEKIFKSKG